MQHQQRDPTPDKIRELCEEIHAEWTEETRRSREVGNGGRVEWKLLTAIGKAAGVKVKDEGGRVKYASAHNFRRSFGQRWAQKLMPAQLMVLMRHESINTTMKFYAGQAAEETAEAAYAAMGLQFNGEKISQLT